MKLKYRQVVIAERCKECGFCIEFCPKQVLTKASETNSRGYHPVGTGEASECTGCNICSMVCPDFAIYVVPVEGKHFSV